MQLVPTEQYESAVTGLPLMNMSIFVSTEDPQVIDYFQKQTKYGVVSYYNYPRRNENLWGLSSRGAEMSLISFANLRRSLAATGAVETMESNWNRMIVELMSTVGENAQGPVFEVGHMNYLTAQHVFYYNDSVKTFD